MGKIQTTHDYPGKQARELYEALIQALPKAGLKVWKRRDVAWLAMVRNATGQDAIDGNASTRPGQVIIALNADRVDEADLNASAEKVFQEIQSIVS